MRRDDWDVYSTTTCKGVRIKYNGNVLYCAVHRTTKANADACQHALAILLGLSDDELTRILPALIEEEGLKMEAYTSR